MKNKKAVIVVLAFICVLLIPVFSHYRGKYLDFLAIEEQKRIEEEERIAREKELARINSLPVSKSVYICLEETRDYSVTFLSGDEVLEINDESFKAVATGECIVYRPETDEKIEVSVSNLYSKAHIDNYKTDIYEYAYTQEEAAYLDKALEARINEVGYQTRAAVVEAARFLSMCFDYKIPYFCENGRMTGGIYCDGEGRFYHKGLYLSEDKYSLIDPKGIIEGPGMWGSMMHMSCGVLLHPNGLDCSGFVTWCLVQAGFDPGDYGAGNNAEGDVFCVPDLSNGDAGAVWLNEIDPDEIQCGDIIAWDGTTAIVVGIDEENLYIAHQYWDNGLEVITSKKSDLKDFLPGANDHWSDNWQYVSLMDDYYKTNGNGTGNYTKMWD
ncbi:MAG: hypothetical protein IJL85_05205 [Erysipelotrichaceae bacterium]|nr:hypothetical protein [Erysipelotrichaceae bacterium]